MKFVPTDARMINLFRQKTWRFGVRFPHQGKRECARRAARASRS